MKSLLYPALVAGLMGAAPAFALTIDFEAAPAWDSVADTYAAMGVDFAGDALAFQNDDYTTLFSNAPAGDSVMAAMGTDAAMNVAAGFTGTASFFYSSFVDTTVGIYSGENGTGDLLASFNLTANALSCASDAGLCAWEEVSVAFGGVAKSIAFGQAAYDTAFDNISVSAVPEPSQAILLALGLSVIGARSLRRRKSVN